MSVPAGRRRRARPLWIVLLAGPAIASVHFAVVYLAAEAACAEGVELIDRTVLRIVIVAATAAAAGLAALCAWRGVRLWRGDVSGSEGGGDSSRFAGLTGAILASLFLFFVLLVAFPAVGSSLC